MENLTPNQKEIEYKEFFCHECDERTSHVSIDTVEGQRFQCEICGAIEESDNGQN